MYLTTHLHTHLLCKKGVDPANNNAPDTHQDVGNFYQTFCAQHQYTHLQYACLDMIGPLGRGFHFRGQLHANYTWILFKMILANW